MLLTGDVWPAARRVQPTSQRLADEMAQLFVEHADLEREVVLRARREALRAERSALGDALRQGSSEDVTGAAGEVDLRWSPDLIGVSIGAPIESENDYATIVCARAARQPPRQERAIALAAAGAPSSSSLWRHQP